jgi:predicted DNA-binding protein (MmcQ/YjbR family)
MLWSPLLQLPALGACKTRSVNKLTIVPERLQRLRALCLALPETTEKVAWGDPTWRVRDRIFAMQKGNHEGGRPSLWLKGAVGAQAMLVESDPVQFFVPPYVGHKGWVGLYLDGPRIQWGMVRELVTESYQLIAPARLTRNAAPSAPKKAGRTRRARS